MEENVAGQVKQCPYCAEEIPVEAGRCPRCNTALDGSETVAEPQYQTEHSGSTGNNGTGMAIASFVLGILGILCCCVGPLGSILAIVFGFISRSQIKNSGATHMSWMATTGIVLGFLNIVLTILSMFAWAALTVLSGNHMGNLPFPMPR
jgi:hypothetical protein